MECLIFIGARNLIDTDTLSIPWCALILPRISYCAESWCDTYRTNLETFILQQQQKRKKEEVIFKCYSSEKLLALNTLHEVVPTWYSFHSWVD